MRQNIKAIYGKKLAAKDGDIGHVSDFYFDDNSWVIRDIVVEAGLWFVGKDVRISAGKVERISYEESRIFASLGKWRSKRRLKTNPARSRSV